MNISIENLNYFITYAGVFVLAAPLLLWLFFRVALPTVAWNGTAESPDDRMVPISRRSLHPPGEVRHGQARRLAQERRLGQDRRNYQVNALAI